MWDQRTLERLNREAEEKEARECPYLLRDAAKIEEWPPFPFPASRRTCKWKGEHVALLLCDYSGWGRPGELGLTPQQLKARLHELFAEHGPLAITLGEIGQFQLHVEIWKLKEEA